jgi:GNAT superfamily N-acetyltransferase
LQAPEIRKAESNEESWWSKWVDETVWVTRDAYAIFSNRFRDEFFFNHGGFLGAEKRVEAVVGSIEKQFGKRELPTTCMFVQDLPSWKELRRHLSTRGYRVADVMSVMEIGEGNRKPVASNPDVEITVMGSRSTAEELREWSGAYLDAFYGSERKLDSVQGIVDNAAKDTMTSLLLARIRKTTVGCAALYRTDDDLAGTYCIGTVPEFRQRHVGTTMLNSMLAIAKREKRKLILQTLLSDSAEGFYLKQGFKRVYSKSVFTRQQNGKGVR